MLYCTISIALVLALVFVVAVVATWNEGDYYKGDDSESGQALGLLIILLFALVFLAFCILGGGCSAW